ncbi:MAG: hypothetical protein AABZ01_07010 [Gemmatimonadota bacterium]
MPFGDLRRALAGAGLTMATARPAGTHGRSDAPVTRPAALIGDPAVRQVLVGAPTSCPEPMAFLDGIQRHQVVAYPDTDPLIGATVAAAVRERHGRQLTTAVHRVEHLLIGRPAALAAVEGLSPTHRRIALDDDQPSHLVLDLDLAMAKVDTARAALEVEVGQQYRDQSDGWLVVDGSLSVREAWATDPRMLGVSKSHSTMHFVGDDLRSYLRLPAGCRSSVFRPSSRGAPVHAWGLRLWPWEGRDLLYGLVRVEAAATDETLARVDELSRWLLAERAPISSRDARWDRLLYGIHNVEEYLRATLGAA